MNSAPRRRPGISKTPSAQPSTHLPPLTSTLVDRAGQNLAAALASRKITARKKAAEPKPYELAPRAPTPSPSRGSDWYLLMSARVAANKAALSARPRRYIKMNVRAQSGLAAGNVMNDFLTTPKHYHPNILILYHT
ncbi:hypothetical protein BU25DRAFT_463943 [Macroventuria anomochaeta]|uniref:Uncharacterized protein n=1 Tax=Macroventuria anomochaeta TaxID=301207 RepID=A0ACB6RGV2_9PLEO|nr:uncharacterized protein BU25DRAFT_463943 [Macroventuria anomochaeta]KAF2621116.1 hypothetical protein BU25DRAFT_463943 [Macroventuria anomochaeta]